MSSFKAKMHHIRFWGGEGEGSDREEKEMRGEEEVCSRNFQLFWALFSLLYAEPFSIVFCLKNNAKKLR